MVSCIWSKDSVCWCRLVRMISSNWVSVGVSCGSTQLSSSIAIGLGEGTYWSVSVVCPHWSWHLWPDWIGRLCECRNASADVIAVHYLSKQTQGCDKSTWHEDVAWRRAMRCADMVRLKFPGIRQWRAASYHESGNVRHIGQLNPTNGIFLSKSFT